MIYPLDSLNEIEVKVEISTEKKEKIKQNIVELLSSSTAHGIPNMIKTSSILFKIIWSIVFILSTCAGSYFVIDSTLDYLKFQTVTNIKVIQEMQSQFPTLSFCSVPSSLLTLNSLKLDQLVLSLRFESVYETNFSHVFEEYNDTVWGKCFRYNSGKNIYGNKIDIINTTVYGKPNNLKIGFYLDGSVKFKEILIQIHNHSSPSYDLENGGYWLRPGSVNYFEVERVFHEKLSEPFSNCLKDVDSFQQNKTIIDEMKNLEISYSQTKCFLLCSHLYALQESNCSCKASLENFNTKCLTNPLDTSFNSAVKICIANYLKTFRIKEQSKKCKQLCPDECDSMSYTISNYFELIPISGPLSSTDRNTSDLAEFKTYEELHEHYIRVYVYYKELKYTLISEDPKTETFNFVSSIGGILGLFLGISFLSFIEIFEIIFEVLCYLINKYNLN